MADVRVLSNCTMVVEVACQPELMSPEQMVAMFAEAFATKCLVKLEVEPKVVRFHVRLPFADLADVRPLREKLRKLAEAHSELAAKGRDG